MSNKMMLVAQREYMENVKTKAFWFGIFLVPVVYALMIIGPALIEKNKSAKKFTVVDESGWVLETVRASIAAEDFSQVLAETAELARDGESLEGLSATLQAAAPRLAEMEPQEVYGVAGNMLAGLGEGVPAELAGKSAEIKQWFQDLEGEHIRTLFERTSRNRWEFVSPSQDTEVLNRMVADEELAGYFVIGPDPVNNGGGSKYVARNLTDNKLNEWFGRRVSDIVRQKRMADKEIDPALAAWMQAPVNFEARKISASGEEGEISVADRVRQWAPAAFVYLLWISIFTISNMLMTNTIEEKSNRLIEVLLSSMSPLQLMSGKMLGIALTGLTVVLTWIGCVIAGAKILPLALGVTLPFDLGVIVGDPFFMVSFGVYFILGYLLYGSVLVGLGSVFNSLKEAQSLMGPVMMVLFIPLMLMIPISEDPNGMLAKITSYIPPLTPFTMMNRAAAPPTTFEYVVTTILLLASIAAALWASAKVFRIGILLTGKPPKVTEMLRWIKAPVGAVPEKKEA